jgi:hypothetical protein
MLPRAHLCCGLRSAAARAELATSESGVLHASYFLHGREHLLCQIFEGLVSPPGMAFM